MRGVIARLLRRVADSFDPPQPTPLRTPLRDRTSAACSLLDDEVLGFVLVQVRQRPDFPMAEVTVAGDVQPEHWTAVGATLKDVARVAYNVR